MNKELLRLITNSAISLIDKLNESQWSHNTDFDKVLGKPLLTRCQLNRLEMPKGFFCTSTSGSTGEPVTVQKTIEDQIWILATNIREYQWRKWDYSKTLAFIKPGQLRMSSSNWGLPRRLAPLQGHCHRIGYEPISLIQQWIDEINPNYLFCAPSIKNELIYSNLTNLIDWKGTGERGGTMYSSEECGTIAIQCPDVPAHYHVMENQIVEVNEDGGIIITTLTNPYIQRYLHGDHIQLGSCTCGRSLQTIVNIHGRVRNMFTLPNGDKKWPLFGSPTYFAKYGIKRFKLIQTSLDSVILKYVADNIHDQQDLVVEIKNLLADVNVILERVGSFTEYKHEEFISLIK